MHGVTKSLPLTVNSFKCTADPTLKRERCGADVFVTFSRDDFWLGSGKSLGFNLDVTLRIQVETSKSNWRNRIRILIPAHRGPVGSVVGSRPGRFFCVAA